TTGTSSGAPVGRLRPGADRLSPSPQRPRPTGTGAPMPQARKQTSERRRTNRRGGSTPSTTPAQRDELRQISDNDDTAIAGLVAIRVEEAVESSDLDAKTFSLVNLAALIATGGDDASYLLHVGAALDAGASVDEVTGVLTSIAP